eukprot:309316_1
MLENTAPFGVNMHEGSNQEQTPLTLWQEEHKLPDNVINILRENDVHSLDDLKLFDNDNELKEFVNSLGITFIMKKKLTNAIKALQNNSNSNDDEHKNQSNSVHNSAMYSNNSIKQSPSINNKDITKCVKSTEIRWECITNVMTTKQMIQIQSNKLENVEMKTTDEKKKKMLTAKLYQDEMGYFEWWGNDIKDLLDYDADGKKMAVLFSTIYAAFTIVPVAPAIYYSTQHFKNKDERQQFAYKKERNSVTKIFNDKLKQIKQLEQRILSKMKELETQEQKLNSHNFEMERFGNLNNTSKTVMVIGPTGFGKSLVANRLLGNKQDSDDISESKQSELFKVAMSGNTHSVTYKLDKKSKIVHILNGNIKQESFILSVIDTPG